MAINSVGGSGCAPAGVGLRSQAAIHTAYTQSKSVCSTVYTTRVCNTIGTLQKGMYSELCSHNWASNLPRGARYAVAPGASKGMQYATHSLLAAS